MILNFSELANLGGQWCHSPFFYPDHDDFVLRLVPCVGHWAIVHQCQCKLLDLACKAWAGKSWTTFLQVSHGSLGNRPVEGREREPVPEVWRDHLSAQGQFLPLPPGDCNLPAFLVSEAFPFQPLRHQGQRVRIEGVRPLHPTSDLIIPNSFCYSLNHKSDRCFLQLPGHDTLIFLFSFSSSPICDLFFLLKDFIYVFERYHTSLAPTSSGRGWGGKES